MKLIETHDEPQTAATEMKGFALIRSRLGRYWGRLHYHMPRLVWPGQEIDVCVTFSQDPLCEDADCDTAMATFFSGGLHEIEQQLGHMGITFDRGQGYGGRDWEWDWSLVGPISVRFRDHARNPERRVAEKRPDLQLVS